MRNSAATVSEAGDIAVKAHRLRRLRQPRCCRSAATAALDVPLDPENRRTSSISAWAFFTDQLVVGGLKSSPMAAVFREEAPTPFFEVV